MRAAFHVDAHRLELRRDVPDPQPGPDEVLIQVKACGFCGSDKHDLETPPRRQQIPGHEFAGIIAGGGDGEFPAGAPVVPNPGIRCGQCPACLSGQDHLCENKRVYGCRGNQPPGGFAEYVKVLKQNLNRVPEGVDFDEITLADPLAVAIHAIRLGPDPRGLNCVIFGAGPIGLLAAQVLAQMNARRVLLVDISASHLKVGKSLGTFETFLIDPATDPFSHDLGGPFDLSLELAGGNAPTLDQAIHYSQRGGTILLISQRPGGSHFNYQHVLFKELKLIGCAGQNRRDFSEAIDWIGSRRIQIKPIISARFPLDEVQSAYDHCITRDALKVIVQP